MQEQTRASIMEGKKDIPMLMRITNDTPVALTKGTGEFS